MYLKDRSDAEGKCWPSQKTIATGLNLSVSTVQRALAELEEGEQRKQRASLVGWHSFRTTFCTLALANGVPMEILRKITGHRTAEIVLKHYDRRGREAMRKALGAAMPKAISGAIVGANAKTIEAESASANAAKVAKMLAGADAKTLAKIAKMLARAKGSK